MREVSTDEIHSISGNGVLTGFGVFLILLIVDEINVNLKRLQAATECSLLHEQLNQAHHVIAEYRALYGELPALFINDAID